MRPVVRRILPALAVAAALAGPSVAHGASPSISTGGSTLRTSFMDDASLAGADRATWLARARAAGASQMRLNLLWFDAVRSAAPPTDAQAIDPGWLGYDFTAFDAQLRAIGAAGLQPLLNVQRAPAWAEGPGRPASAGKGTWKPDARAYGLFMQAVAKRYSGSYPDPATPGRSLPKVKAFQLWNEPNLNVYLAPQWDGGSMFSPGRFRDLVNAGYAGVKRVSPDATVVAGGLAPYGDPGVGGARLAPARFARSMFCLNLKLRRTCGEKVTADAFSEHPYAVRGPLSKALNRDDIVIGDFGKLQRIVNAAVRARTTGPGRPKIWSTEVSYDSRPPDPKGVPSARHARWTAQTLWKLWSQGARVVLWYLIRDAAPVPDYASTYQSGMVLRDGRAKPSLVAFRFPVVVTSRTRTRLSVWVRSPRKGRASVQVRRGGRWRTVRRASVRADGVLRTSVPRSRTTAVRARVGGETSYVWSTR